MHPHPTRVTALTGLALAAALVLSGCAPSSPGPAEDTPTTFVAQTSLNTLDPLLSDTIQNDVVDDLLYDSILDYDDNAQIVPRIATEWTVADDALSIDLTLRDDVVFSDGTPLTAADVVYSLDRIATAGIGAASFLTDYASATAVDDTHVTITLARPNTTFLGALSKIYVVNSAVVEQNVGTDNAQAWLAANAAGSGPYILQDYTQATSVKMSLNADYWAYDADRPDTYVLEAFEESAGISTALRGGSLNLGTLPATDAATFENNPDYVVTDLPSGSGSFVFFNTKSGPTADPKVREAIELAYDYDGHVKTILGGKGTVASSVLPDILGCDIDMPDKKQNVKKAKELLAEAGAENLTLTLMYQPTLPEHNAAATLLQSNLRDIGITLNLQTTTFPAYNDALKSIATTPDLAIANDRARYPDPFVMLNRQFNSAFVEKGSNRGQYSNPEVDEILAEAQVTPDAADRCSLYQKLEEVVAADHAVMPLANAELTYVSSANVEGVQFSPVRLVFDPLSIRVQ